MSEEKQYTNLRVAESRKMKIERAAIEVSVKERRIMKWTDFVFYLIDNYTDEAKRDLLAKRKD